MIYQFIVKNKDIHVTAEDIAEYLKLEGKPVGKSTVYRQLDKFVSQGLVRRYFLEEGMGACYQYADCAECHAHYHLKCVGCGKLIHLSCDFLDELDAHILREHRFHIDHTKTVLYGLCEDCAEKEEGKVK